MLENVIQKGNNIMVKLDLRSELPEDAVVFDNPSYDGSIIGVSEDGRVVYDYNAMIPELINDYKESGYDMDEMEAEDFISYNTIRALSYVSNPQKPIVIFPLDF